jgi:hypothetical protein
LYGPDCYDPAHLVWTRLPFYQKIKIIIPGQRFLLFIHLISTLLVQQEKIDGKAIDRWVFKNERQKPA